MEIVSIFRKNLATIFVNPKLSLLNFKILGVLDVFDGAESISTIENTIQALSLQDFLNFFAPNSIPFHHPPRQLRIYWPPCPWDHCISHRWCVIYWPSCPWDCISHGWCLIPQPLTGKCVCWRNFVHGFTVKANVRILRCHGHCQGIQYLIA